jgi:hypothetical protein
MRYGIGRGPVRIRLLTRRVASHLSIARVEEECHAKIGSLLCLNHVQVIEVVSNPEGGVKKGSPKSPLYSLAVGTLYSQRSRLWRTFSLCPK